MKVLTDQNERVALSEMKKDVEWSIAFHQKELSKYQSRLSALNKIELINTEE